jgi:tripartite-type tricarboxylate transporter receptor subunit TctC
MKAALAILAAAVVGLAQAQPAETHYPTRVIRMMVPFPPAGPTDVIARPLIEKMSTLWPYPIVAEWRPGGNTLIGTDAVAKAPADGYTWLLTTFTHTTAPALNKSLPFDPIEDFSGAAMVATFPAVAVVPASSPANTMPEFIALAKSQPGKLNYLIPGIGTSVHLNSELLKMHAGIDMTAVPYKGLAPAMPDLLSGRLAFGFMSLSLAVPHIKSGKLRALALAAPRRNALLPEVPTMAEAGYPESQVLAWFAILVPAKTPRDIVARINRDVSRAMADPEVVKRIEGGGVTVESPMSPEAIDALMKREVVHWAKFIKDARIELQ